MRRTNYWVLLLAPLVFGPACDCGDNTNGGTGGGAGGGVGGGAAGGIAVPDGGFPDGGIVGTPDGGVCQLTACPDGVLYACGDCVDNDDDGKMDTGGDPDCLGPCDNNEAGYNINLSGQPEQTCRVDCYYDSNSGRGCDWSWNCDPLEPRLDDQAHCSEILPPNSVIGSLDCNEVAATHDDPAECDYCTQLTPPGCDCFGCCEIPARSGNFVFIGTMTEAGVRTCNFDEAMQEYNDSSGTPEERLAQLAQVDRQCRLCTPTPSCYNPCDDPNTTDDDCDVCLGQTEPPAGCTQVPPTACNGGPTCAPLSNDACPSGTFCFFGCCETVVPL